MDDGDSLKLILLEECQNRYAPGENLKFNSRKTNNILSQFDENNKILSMITNPFLIKTPQERLTSLAANEKKRRKEAKFTQKQLSEIRE